MSRTPFLPRFTCSAREEDLVNVSKPLSDCSDVMLSAHSDDQSQTSRWLDKVCSTDWLTPASCIVCLSACSSSVEHPPYSPLGMRNKPSPPSLADHAPNLGVCLVVNYPPRHMICLFKWRCDHCQGQSSGPPSALQEVVHCTTSESRCGMNHRG